MQKASENFIPHISASRPKAPVVLLIGAALAMQAVLIAS